MAIGDVGGLNVANLQAGGLVGDNSGTILSSSAFGNVQAGDGSNAGGLGRIQFDQQLQLRRLHARRRFAVTSTPPRSSTRTRSATSRSARRASPADCVGAGDGFIASSTAIGNVLGGGNSVLGGFIGALSFENGAGVILASGAAGSVTSTGPNSIVGGFAGLTGGTIFALDLDRRGHRRPATAISAASPA